MTGRVFVDSGAWIALADADDGRHERAAELLERFLGGLVTSNFVFDETATRCARLLGVPAAVRFCTQLLDPTQVEIVPVTREDERSAWERFRTQPVPVKSGDRPMSFTDCTSLAIMDRLGLKAIAYDRHFRDRVADAK